MQWPWQFRSKFLPFLIAFLFVGCVGMMVFCLVIGAYVVAATNVVLILTFGFQYANQINLERWSR